VTNDNLTKCLALLESFDWTYEMSDDHRYWTAGQSNKAACMSRYKLLTDIEKTEIKTWVKENLVGKNYSEDFYKWAITMVGL
jgi:hypothetical protein